MSQYDLPYHCFLDTVHVKRVFPVVVGYHVVTSLFFSYIFVPHALLVTLPALIVCALAVVAFTKRIPNLLLPFRIYVYFSIFFLLFLGAYMFFISIFNKEKHEWIAESLFSPSVEFFSIAFHLVSNLATLLAMWQLSLISTTAKYLRHLQQGSDTVTLSLPPVNDPMSAVLV
ncbi:unnamed protein product, partial [Mesorhabditis spiculigera]